MTQIGHGHDQSSRPTKSKALIAIFRQMGQPNAIFVSRPSRLGEGRAPPLIDDALSVGGKPVEGRTARPEIPDASLGRLVNKVLLEVAVTVGAGALEFRAFRGIRVRQRSLSGRAEYGSAAPPYGRCPRSVQSPSPFISLGRRWEHVDEDMVAEACFSENGADDPRFS